jgi:putative PIN family toxin of toxin-antitoxin system
LVYGEILVSNETAEELHEVLGRDRFDAYLRREERDEFLDALIRDTTLIEITKRFNVCRDPKDDKFLDLAVSGRASYIITGDNDLLVLNPFEGIQVLSPSQFLIRRTH